MITRNKMTWQFALRILRLWLPVVALLAGVLWMLHRTEMNAQL
jgi:hypothetical protein